MSKRNKKNKFEDPSAFEDHKRGNPGLHTVNQTSEPVAISVPAATEEIFDELALPPPRIQATAQPDLATTSLATNADNADVTKLNDS